MPGRTGRRSGSLRLRRRPRCRRVRCSDSTRAARRGRRPREGVRHRDLLEVPQRESMKVMTALYDGDQFADRDPARRAPAARPYQTTAISSSPGSSTWIAAISDHIRALRTARPADLLGGRAVAVEEQLLAADAAQHAQPGDGVGGQLGGPARLLALDVGAPRGAGQQRQHGERQHRHADGDHDAERGLVDDQADADDHDGERRRRRTGETASTNQPIFSTSPWTRRPPRRRRPAGSARSPARRPCGPAAAGRGRRRDPVGDRGAVEEGRPPTWPRRTRAAAPRPAISWAGTVDDRLDGETDGERSGGDTAEVEQAPKTPRGPARAAAGAPARQ